MCSYSLSLSLSQGAPESVLQRCKFFLTNQGKQLELTEGLVSDLSRQYQMYAQQGLRCLALAKIDNPSGAAQRECVCVRERERE